MANDLNRDEPHRDDAGRDDGTIETMPLPLLRARTREALRLVAQARVIVRGSIAAARVGASGEDAARRVGLLVDAAHRLLPGSGGVGLDEAPTSRFGVDANDALRAMVAVLHSDAAHADDVQRTLSEAGIDVERFLDSIERAELIESFAAELHTLVRDVEATNHS